MISMLPLQNNKDGGGPKWSILIVLGFILVMFKKYNQLKLDCCCRFAYNYFLDDFNKNGYTSKFAKNNKCNQELKTEYPWLKEVDK